MVPPILPAPIKAIFFRATVIPFPSLHTGYDSTAKSRAAHKLCAGHQPLEIIGDGLIANSSFQPLDDEFVGFRPASVAEHHLAGLYVRSVIDFLQDGVFRRGAVGILDS